MIGRNWWIAVDLDGVLAHFDYEQWLKQGMEYIGPPVARMLELVKYVLKYGYFVSLDSHTFMVDEVKIFTARASMPEAIPYIQAWLDKYGLGDLEITNVKDTNCIEIWDDRAKEVELNTGKFVY